MILVDTHILIHYAVGDRRLGKRATAAIDRARQRDQAWVSAISFWEVAMLAERKRLKMSDTPMGFRTQTLKQGFFEQVLDGVIAIRSAELAWRHADPADRIIVTTAIALGATLITSDTQVLAAKLSGLRVQDGTC